MPVFRATDQVVESGPPSPICSETLSINDATSDLENLSDCSGLSVSDEDEKRSRSYTESDSEILSDCDLEEITHSMLASSADLRRSSSHQRFFPPSSPANRSISTSTSEDIENDQGSTSNERTPSASFHRSERISSYFNSKPGRLELSYPRLDQRDINRDIESPFGLSCNLNTLYRTIEEEKAISEDQDLKDFSVLDVKGENLRTKYDRSIQTDIDDTTTLMNSSSTQSIFSDSTLKLFPTKADNPDMVLCGAWPGTLSAADVIESEETELEQFTELSPSPTEEASSAGTLHRGMPGRWLGNRTFGLVAVVLLGIAVHQAKDSTWNGVFSNAVNFTSASDPAQLFLVAPDVSATQQAAPATMTFSDTVAQVEIPVDIPGISAAHSDSPIPVPDKVSMTPRAAHQVAVASFPHSVSALVSFATSGFASLSTQVASTSFMHRQKEYDSKASTKWDASVRKKTKKRSQRAFSTVSEQEDDVIILEPPSRDVGRLPQRSMALSTLPKRAQQGLALLTQRSAQAEPYCRKCKEKKNHPLKHSKLQKKDKQGLSRRTEKHWIQNVDHDIPPLNPKACREMPIAEGNIEFDRATPRRVFSSINASRLGRKPPRSSALVPVVSDSDNQEERPSEEHSEDQISQDWRRLFLEENVRSLPLSLRQVCQTFDNIFLSYAQQAVDFASKLDYQYISQLLQRISSECFGRILPYATTIGEVAKKDLAQLGQQAVSMKTLSRRKTGDLSTYFQAHYHDLLHTSFRSIVETTKATKDLRKKTERTISQIKKASRKAKARVRSRSKDTLSRARRNSRALFSRQKSKMYKP